jgi:hypothetical protein
VGYGEEEVQGEEQGEDEEDVAQRLVHRHRADESSPVAVKNRGKASTRRG